MAKQQTPETGKQSSSGIEQANNVRDWWRHKPNQALIVYGVAAGLCGLGLLQLQDLTFFPYWMLCFFFAMMILLRSIWMLSICFGLMFVVEFGPSLVDGSVELRITQLELGDLAFALLALLFAGTSLRFLEVHRYNLSYFSEFGASNKSSTDSQGRFPALLGGRWVGILFAFAMALLLLQIYPLDQSSVVKYWIKPRAMRVIFLIGSIFLIWFLVRGIFALICRWQMDPDQARVMMRSVFANEHWKEHRGIESRLEKINQKQAMSIEQRE